jgi:hypothetical protein
MFGMNLPFPLPDWLPWWAPVAVLVPVLLYLLVFLVMPFSVFGLKGRLDGIEARLDEIQGEIRTLVLRLPELRGSGSVASSWADPPPIAPAPEDDRLARPPVPPAPVVAPRRPPLPPVAPQIGTPHAGAPSHSPAPGWRPGPDPRISPSPDEHWTEQHEPDAGDDREDGGPRRRPVIRPSRPPRSEPRLDWP